MLSRPIKGRAVRDACELYLGQSDALPICTAYIQRTRVTTTYKRSWRTLWLVRKPHVVSVNTSKRWEDRKIIRHQDMTRSDAAYKRWEFKPVEVTEEQTVLAFKVEIFGDLVREEDFADLGLGPGDTVKFSYKLGGN